MLCLIYLRANLRNGVSPCGRKCFWLRLLLVSWLVPPFPFKRPRQMPLGAAAISSPRQDTPTITRRERRSSTTARVNGSCTKLPIGVVLRRRPNLSKWQGIRGPRGSPFHLASHGASNEGLLVALAKHHVESLMDHGPGHWMGEKANVEALGCHALARCPLDRPSRKDAPICKPNCKPTTRHRTVSKDHKPTPSRQNWRTGAHA